LGIAHVHPKGREAPFFIAVIPAQAGQIRLERI